MCFEILNDIQKNKYKNDIIKLLEVCDNDFVPPLSSRNSTLQSDFNNAVSSNGVISYYNEMNKQNILAAIEGDALIGLVSFRENYISDIVTDEYIPNIYISTVFVSPESRGNRLTTRMYDYLFNFLCADKTVFTRTWSTNTAHIKILSYFSFSEFYRIPNDRGEGIDTIYFKK